MNVIIQADLLNPPTEALYLRYLTLVTQSELHLYNLIETPQDVKDIYYHYMKKRGLFDFIDQLVTPEEDEFGIRLSNELNYPLTIKTKAITCVNVVNILGQIKMLSKI